MPCHDTREARGTTAIMRGDHEGHADIAMQTTDSMMHARTSSGG